MLRTALAASALAALALTVGAVALPEAWAQQGVTITPVLKSSTTMTGQKVEYSRTDKPEVTSALAVIEPGGEIGRHMHHLSGHVYVMEGTLTVEMDDGARHEYRSGQAFLESTQTWHNAKNLGTEPVKVFIVWFGEEGKPNIIRPEPGTAATTPAGGGATDTSGAAAPASGARPTESPK